ncbi:IS630 family transposase [Nostoc sp. T09]|uniref:IS630 family transposase n=1 Tax=Nostoc sp. T09 TaxID=1932621 RepID=UPI0011800804|nr:IS630 family transposase [Nostoc sp. T09]
MGKGRRDKVLLNTEQRRKLEEISRNGYASAKKILHAQVLLMCDEGEGATKKWTDEQISLALNLHRNTVGRIRKRFLEQGEQPALNRSQRKNPPVPAKIDGHTEAQIIALCCSDPPTGRAHWSLRLLTQEIKNRNIITEISVETVKKHIKKNELRPWKIQRFCIPERDLARFISQMEVVLDLYSQLHSELSPLICMDEASIQLTGHVFEPIPLEPGHDAKVDYHYTREGVQALFMFFDPNRGWRRVSNRDHRTRVDWAIEVRRLLDEDYPHAHKVKLVCDNLNTHNIASLYEAFPAPEAHRLARKLEIYYTPRNGSWLNVAEIELSVLSQQCLDRRISSVEELSTELAAWQQERNSTTSKVIWHFTTDDARVKLKHLYPIFEPQETGDSNASF